MSASAPNPPGSAITRMPGWVTRFACIASVLGALFLTPPAAQASEDTYGAGDGHHGDFSASALGVVPNMATSVITALSAGDSVVEVDDSSIFHEGDLALVWQATGAPAPSTGDANPVDLGATNVGRYELARVASTTLFSVVLRDPLLRAYSAGATQIVLVPEFATLTVPAGTSLAAMPWSPSSRTGGILALFVRDTLTNGGLLDATGAGMQGGRFDSDSSGTLSCSALTLAAPNGAARGEGVALGSFNPAQTGRGNLANGGGGGVCFAAGGGGGGQGGTGGQGGRSDATSDGGRNVGGLGGARLNFSSLVDRLVIGAGGGAGHGQGVLDDATGAGNGAAGGGVIFLRAQSVSGAGSIRANGATALAATVDAAGGGGAGGSVLVQTAAAASCTLAANGGGGGQSAQLSGTGGGGGGGRTLVQSASGTCPASVLGGAAGLDPGSQARLATAGSAGLNDAAPVGALIVDHDADGVLDAAEGLDDPDLDTVAAYLDSDDDDDGVATLLEGGNLIGGTAARDTDQDGLPDYLDDDDDNDTIPTSVEGAVANTDLDPLPNYRDADDDGDSIATRDEDLDKNGVLSNDDPDLDAVAAYLDSDDDDDGVGTLYEDADGDDSATNDDSDGDLINDYLDVDDDGDGILTEHEAPDANADRNPSDARNSDADLLADYLDSDDDGDTLLTRDEAPDMNSDRDPSDARNSDSDLLADYLDSDDDGDGVATRLEDENGDGKPGTDNRDGDALPNFRDADDDGDGVPTLSEAADPNADHDPADARNSDTDALPDYLDDDDDGDGLSTRSERPLDTSPNLDGDTLADYLDSDDDGDGLPTAFERPGATDADYDEDGTADHLDGDDDEDGVDTRFEDIDENGDPRNDDSDDDDLADYLDEDDDDDTVPTLDEAPDANDDGDPADARDQDKDGIADYIDADDDGDELPTVDELGKLGSQAPTNTDGDGLPNFLDADDDGDGVKSKYEHSEGDQLDTDGDRVPNHLDDDDDEDSLLTEDEAPDANDDGNPRDARDTDGDRLADFLDMDDDDDGIETVIERDDAKTWGSDVDKDKIKNWLDTDSDGDEVLDQVERVRGGDMNDDGKPDYLDAMTAPQDSDDDGLSNEQECPANSTCADTDDDGHPDYDDADDDGDGLPTLDERRHGESSDQDIDGIPDFLDPDDDNDSVPTRAELVNKKALDTDADDLDDHFDIDDDDDGILTSVENAGDVDDVDEDGAPNWRDTDSDGDGVSDADEGVQDTNANGVPAFLDPIEAPFDLDEDGVPDVVECPEKLSCIDTDGDTLSNERDDDDDGDGISTLDERPEGKNVDHDEDGTPDYLDSDDDGDKAPTSVERSQGMDLDSDGDGTPDRFDDDDDNDGLATEDEYIPGHVLDSDGDGKPDHLDTDDDGDGISTKTERNNAKRFGEDIDSDGLPNYLDSDTDGDGVPDAVEGTGDTDGDGVPDSLTQGGIAGGALCSALPGTRNHAAWPVLLLALAWLVLRRRQRRRWRRSFASMLSVPCMLLAAAGAAAASPGVVLDQYRPAPSGDDTFSVSRPKSPGHLRFETRLTLSYANDPLVYESNSGARTSERTKLVSDQLAMNLGVSLGLLDPFLVYASLPVNLVMNGQPLGVQPTATGFGGGDLAFGGRVVFFSAAERGAMAFSLDATLPTGEGGTLGPAVARDSGLTFTPTFIGELGLSVLRITLNIGVRFRKDVVLPSTSFGDELSYGLAVSVPLVKSVLDAHVMGFGVTPQDDIGRRANSPLETLAGLTLRTDESWSFGLGGGAGLLRGYGAPDFRIVATSAWRLPSGSSQSSQPTAAEPEPTQEEYVPVAAPVVTVAPPPPTRDTDNDAMPDAEDQCPILPGPVDLGGCPEYLQYSSDTGLLTWRTPLHWRARQAVLEPSTRPLLEDLARALTTNRALHVLIEVHVPPQADPAQGLQLTLDRAKALALWLRANGIERARIDAYGCGGSRPLAGLKRREQGQNERTEVYVVQPLPEQGMPSSLNCQAVELPGE